MTGANPLDMEAFRAYGEKMLGVEEGLMQRCFLQWMEEHRDFWAEPEAKYLLAAFAAGWIASRVVANG